MALDKLQIRFEDLFLPLSLPEMFQNVSNHCLRLHLLNCKYSVR